MHNPLLNPAYTDTHGHAWTRMNTHTKAIDSGA